MQAKSENPKVLHVVLSMVVGGAEKLVYDMVRHPTFAESRPVIACLDEVGELGEKLTAEGFSVHIKYRKSGLDWGVIPWLREIIRNEKITVVHAHQYTPLFYTVPAAFLAGRVKVVYTEHGRFYPDRKSWKRTIFNPLLALGVDHLISISAATSQAMATYDNFPHRKIKVIHNGVDFSKLNPKVDLAEKRRELGLNESCRVVGTAARLNEIKNLPMMLRVFQNVLEEVPDAFLLIAGEGPQMGSLEELAHQLNISENVRFLGLRFDLPEIYLLFDVFLLTSYTEGISVTLLESMASGIPTVVTNVGGNGEVVLEGRTGYMVPVGADSVMAQKVVDLLKDSLQAKEFGTAGKKRVNQTFSFNNMIQTYSELYKS